MHCQETAALTLSIPTNGDEWFASLPDASSTGFQIGVCEAGTACDDNGFFLIADSSTLGGDHGAFYTPYILDPQNPNGEMFIGTCRVWRLNSSGAVQQLSNDFDNLGTGVCTGGEVELVSSLDAGGPRDGSGNSKVVYATTDGTGPLAKDQNGAHRGGDVWMTTNAGVALMSKVTQNINPSFYATSSVAMDKSDLTGKTAYVGIMGFHVSHVWKTTNAGTSWTDWTGSGATALPDAPVDALLVDPLDPQGPKIYAGTDAGIFVSSTSAASWTEVGPAPGPSATGFLPNAPVTAIRIFDDHAGNRVLRVSTYGRGIWESSLAASPDFTNVVSDSPKTVFPTQTAQFHGTLAVQGGYNNAINLSCAGTPPSTCTLNPTQMPAPGSGTYTVTAGGAVGDYNFNAHATDGTITHDAAVTLHVVDFNLTAPNPNTVTAQQGGTSNNTTFQVTASGAFAGSVTLTCPSGLPLGAACHFSPSNTVSPTSANPVTVTLNVSTTGSTPTGTKTVTLQADTAGEPAPRQTTFDLTVIPPDFTWVINGASAKTVLAGQSATFAFNAAPSGSPTFTSDVTLTCSNLPALTACSFDKQIKAGDSATTVTLTITTTGPNTGTVGPQRADNRKPWLPLTLPIAGVVMVGMVRRMASRRLAIVARCVSLALLGLLVACGGGGGSSPPPPISVTVSQGVPASLFPNQNGWPSQTAQFTATVNNSTNQSVTWAVAGGAVNGTIDANGLYTAPTLGPGLPATVTVTATSQADSSKSGSRSEALNTPTALGTFTITVTATDSAVAQSQNVSLTVQ